MSAKTPDVARRFNIVVDPETVTPDGRQERLEADEATRVLIARRLGVPAVHRLNGDFVVRRTAPGIDLEGALEAALTRECVVSLEPLDEVIAENFAISFSAIDAAAVGGAELDLEPDALEPLPEGGIDLGEVLVQQLALAMEPYPRKDDAPPVDKEYAGAPAGSAFSALRGLFAGKPDKG